MRKLCIIKMKKFFSVLSDMFFTKRCPGCGRMLPVFEDKDICENCADDFIDISDKLFYVRELEFLKAVYLFSGPPRHGLHRFKFRNDGSAGRFFADRICEMICKEKKFIDTDIVIVPIPGNVKDTDREYVQAEFLAKRIARKLKIACVCDAIRKRKAVKSQTKCRTVAERRKNAQNAFILNKGKYEKLAGKNVLLIDDISTTGSTLSSAAETLKKAGVEKIYGVCVAKTPTGKERKGRYIIPYPEEMKMTVVDAVEYENKR